MSSMSGQDHRAGWFERAFTEIDDLGSGEFGKVMKVRRNADGEVYAVKKSRQFEGGRQR
jgi:mitosis inhibitor protein kinase SWE1